MVIPELQAALWWANKELQDGKLLSDYVGRSDGTKIMAKIQKIGQGAPARYISSRKYRKNGRVGVKFLK